MSEKIRQYWEDRAASHADAQATTSDIHLRELEAATLLETLAGLNLGDAPRALDVGCGDGQSPLHLAASMPTLRLLGVDYAENMVLRAREKLATMPALQGRVAFRVGDATNLTAACGDERFDVAMTDRCLINLDTPERQRQAIAAIAAQLRPGGYYVAIENFVEGQDALNQCRRHMGLPEIPIRWHNFFFREADWLAAVEPYYDEVRFKDFSSAYYYATRVIYSAYCHLRGEQPDYNHEIHRLAVKLPWMGQYSPIRMVVMRRRAA